MEISMEQAEAAPWRESRTFAPPCCHVRDPGMRCPTGNGVLSLRLLALLLVATAGFALPLDGWHCVVAVVCLRSWVMAEPFTRKSGGILDDC